MAPTSRESRAAFWRAHLHAWRGSGLSQAAYCRLHGLSLRAMRYRKRTLSLDVPAEHDGTTLASQPGKDPGVTFVPVLLPRSPAGVEAVVPLQVVLGKRIRIQVDGDFDPALLAKLVRTLEALA